MPFLIALVTALVLAPVSVWLGHATGLVDVPGDPLKIHRTPVSVLGGLAVVVPTLAGALISSHRPPVGTLVAICVLAATGLVDDARPLPAPARLPVQLAAGLLLALSGARLTPLGMFGGAGTVVLLLMCVNGINMIDGQDGLAGGLAAIAALGLVALAGHASSWGIVLALALGGALCGFLAWNRPPARIFLGNSGPGALAVVVVVAVAALAHADGWRGLLAGGVCTGVFLFEMVFTLVRRLGRASLMTGDRLHSYDLLAERISRPRVTLMFWAAGAGLVGVAAAVDTLPVAAGAVVAGAVAVSLALAGRWLWSLRPEVSVVSVVAEPSEAVGAVESGGAVGAVGAFESGAAVVALAPARRYLVTGAAGFIGSHLVDELLDRGHEVIGIDAFRPGYDRETKRRNLLSASANGRFELREQDLLEIDLEPLLLSVDGVFHLAAQPGVRTSWGSAFDDYLRDNVLATQRVFEAAATVGRRVLVASSSSVYGNAKLYPVSEHTALGPVSPYGVTKAAVEQLAHAYAGRGLDCVVLRYFTVYGPRQRPDMAFMRVAASLLGNATFELFGDGRQLRDVTYVGDVVEATIASLLAAPAGSVMNVGSGREVSLRAVISAFEDAFGVRLRVHELSAAAGDMNRTLSDCSLIERTVGWRASTPLEAGVAAQLEWAQEQLGAEPAALAVGQ